jgi:hypothetical protein
MLELMEENIKKISQKYALKALELPQTNNKKKYYVLNVLQ